MDIRHATVNVSDNRTQLSHLVHFVDATAGDIVQTVEVSLIARNLHVVVLRSNGNNRLKDRALAFLNPLTHRVKVGRVVDSCRENALVVLTFALAVELFPPFAEVVKFRVIVHEDFNLLACVVERVTRLGVEIRNIGIISCSSSSLHVLRTLEELTDVVASNGDWKQTYRSEH